MSFSAEWRTGIFDEMIVIVEEDELVRAVLQATPERLSSFLTYPGDFGSWTSDRALDPDEHDPEVFGRLGLARANTGEVIEMDPELFWDGIYRWFRSRGVDYDTKVAAN